MAKLKLGVDVGGTFTDVVGINEDGKVYFAKTPSTPEDYTNMMNDAIAVQPLSE